EEREAAIQAEKRAKVFEMEKQVQDRNLRIVIISSISFILLIIGYMIAQRYRREKKRALEKLFFKEQKLSDFTFSMLKKNQVLLELEEKLKDSNKKTAEELSDALNRMKKILNINKSEEENWNQFLEHFGAVHSNFFDKLKRKHPELSNKELKHCALIKMNLSVKESADLLSIEANSVKMARYRLKKKLGLGEEDNLNTFLTTI
ncbi:MAG: hypothetical protein AAF391_06435, partial [Bacteroidota bacterium]